MENEYGVPVFFSNIEYSFGSLGMVMDRDQVLHLDSQIQAYHAHEGKAIFVLFFGVVNHWITIIIHKSGANAERNEFYVLDSVNIKHLNKPEEDLEPLSLESRCWKKIRVGIKPTIKFMCEMSIQSLFDQRNLYYKLYKIFDPTDDLTICKLHASNQVNYMLKEFHLVTQTLNPNADNELKTPPQTSEVRSHHGATTDNELPTISQDKVRFYRKHFDEEWYQQKC